MTARPEYDTASSLLSTEAALYAREWANPATTNPQVLQGHAHLEESARARAAAQEEAAIREQQARDQVALAFEQGQMTA
jgi:hypothetical protein